MKKIALSALSILGAALALLLIVIVARTLQFAAPPFSDDIAVPDAAAYALDIDAASAHLSRAIQFNTVSLADEANDDRSGFENFQAWLETTYPAFHAAAQLERVGELSLLYTWRGSDPAQAPIILLAHQDTVPVPEDTLQSWSAAPFGGEIKDGVIWGRGTLDDKQSVIALLEAAEMFAREGRQPKRTIIFAFGHDEEIGGARGARAIVERLEARGVHAWFVLDEGLAAIEDHPLTGGSAALIGIAEKGEGTLLLRAEAEAGHSSMPPQQTAVSRLAEAVTRVHDMPIERRLSDGPVGAMMRALAPRMNVATRTAIANEWLFAPVLNAELADDRAAQALMGTTVAPTMISGGQRPNVLPASAEARINMRIHPRDAPENLLAHARQAVSDVEGVSIDWDKPPRRASPVSSASSSSYALIAAASRAVLPEARVAPGLVVGGTDARHYAPVAENLYRYQAIMLGPEDWEAIHGVNEHISVENFERLIRFYAGLIDAGAM